LYDAVCDHKGVSVDVPPTVAMNDGAMGDAGAVSRRVSRAMAPGTGAPGGTWWRVPRVRGAGSADADWIHRIANPRSGSRRDVDSGQLGGLAGHDRAIADLHEGKEGRGGAMMHPRLLLVVH